MTPAEYNLPEHTSGDTFNGIPSITILVNGQPPTSGLVSAKMQFKKTAASSTVLEFSTENGLIVIDDPVNWELSVPKSIVTACPYTYVYDLQTVDAQGNVKTYLKGEWAIKEDVTK